MGRFRIFPIEIMARRRRAECNNRTHLESSNLQIIRKTLDGGRRRVYHGGMRMGIFLLMSAMAAASVVGAQEPVAASAAPSASAVASAVSPEVAELLARMEKENSQDFYAVMEALLAEMPLDKVPEAMQKAAEAGSPAAVWWLSRWDMTRLASIGADRQTHPLAVQHRAAMQKAALTGYLPARLEYMRMVGGGVGAAADEKRAMGLLMDICATGDARARAEYLLLSGRLEKADALDAPEITSELKKKNAYLEELIGTLYGREPQAQQWLQEATEHGSAEAPRLLAAFFAESLGEQRFQELMQLAAERHSPSAVAFQGIIRTVLRDGSLNTEDEKARRLLEIALLLGAAEGVAPLSMHYIGHPEQYFPDRLLALSRIGMEMGNEVAAVNYAYCMACGYGCKAAPERAIALLEGLAEAGVGAAHVALASVFYNGRQGKADLRRAVDELGQGASLGMSHMYSTMAALTAMGNAVTKPDAGRAAALLKMAKEQEGELEAQTAYDSIMEAKTWGYFSPTL